jgi:hypothetical protein
MYYQQYFGTGLVTDLSSQLLTLKYLPAAILNFTKNVFFVQLRVVSVAAYAGKLSRGRDTMA